MLNICDKCGKTYHNSDQHQCYWFYGSYMPPEKGYKLLPYEIEARSRIINNLNKLRSLSQSCPHMIPAVCGLVAEIQTDINTLWGRNG